MTEKQGQGEWVSVQDSGVFEITTFEIALFNWNKKSLIIRLTEFSDQKSDGVESSSLPAHPPRSKRFCSSQGIVTPPTQTTILSRAQETIR